MLVELVRIDGDDVVPEQFLLDSLPAVLGRSGEVDIMLDDRWVSRWHCKLLLSDDQLIVRDLGSKHGTWVNGRTVSESPLENGDVLTVGLSSFDVIVTSDEDIPVTFEEQLEMPPDAADSWSSKFKQLFPPPTFY